MGINIVVLNMVNRCCKDIIVFFIKIFKIIIYK